MPTAIDLARAVRAGDLDPVSIAVDALARICSGDAAFGAFRRVRREEAVVEARALKERSDLAELALAGVPIAVKDVTAVAGETPGWAASTRSQPCDSDSDVVARLRAAGAVIVGLTRAPELCLWPMTDTREAVVRNPWAPAYTAGGSSGGSAAAVAAGLVPFGARYRRALLGPLPGSALRTGRHHTGHRNRQGIGHLELVRHVHPRPSGDNGFRRGRSSLRSRRATRTSPGLCTWSVAHRHIRAADRIVVPRPAIRGDDLVLAGLGRTGLLRHG